MLQRRKGPEGRPKRGRQAKRTNREWAARGALAFGALVLGYTSVNDTLANVIVKLDPQRAYVLDSGDGRITAAFAEQEFAATLDSDPASEPASLARQALRQDPTAVEALNVLGLQAQLRNEEALTDRLFSYSVTLSRRELRPQIWAIEKAVARGDIQAALDNYDVALRTSGEARKTLFPVLASAISEPRIRAPLISVLLTEPNWDQPFVRYVATRSPNPKAVAQLFLAAARMQMAVEDADRVHVVRALVDRGQVEEAWAYYTTFRSDARRTRSRDPGFDLQANTRAPFDWNMGQATGLSAGILNEKEGGGLYFAVPPAIGATVVSQIQLLPPGRYRLEGRSSGIHQPEHSQPYWTLTCQAGPELGRVEVPNSTDLGGTFVGQFTVPADCPVQALSLVVRASDEVAGVSGQIDHVQLSLINH